MFDLTGRTALVTGAGQGIGLGIAAALAKAGAAVDGLEGEGIAIDILVNNAGIQRRGPLEEIGRAAWRELMATNLDGTFFVSQAVARHMLGRRCGKIVNIGSVLAALARPTTAPYAASKGAVLNLTRAMCADWAPHGLQVNAIAPGYIQTPLNRSLMDDPQFDAWIRGRTPAGRWGRVEDLGGAAVFLSSPAANFINGQMLYVDGGITAVV